MARTASFDRDTVVRAALDVFWRVGYEAAAIPEIELATGLSRSSLYNTFGSKRGLFDAAVALYLDGVIRPRLRPLQADPVAPGAIAEYLAGLRDALARPDSAAARSGCLLVNTAGAPIAEDAAVAGIITAYRAELRTALGRGIAACLPDLPGPDAARLADACTGQLLAAYALARVDAAAAAAAADTALALIEAAA
ncbi:TetR/AcrR family transcriptional regulator [Leucobacter allii]|uniref:TetR/AcrR family transcriptional regulator n=1 Tax=Leucobacter allii TaxID=2932247 RepID=A0ABY4FLI0_9MICO|nr:TetR/AcrR family transcriptional regulator [Leucobacter allii]UOQ57129.1 TetR/AcrR family transcriptional regulator [Leucobacter allii]